MFKPKIETLVIKQQGENWLKREAQERKSCVKCKHYSMTVEEDRGRTSFDLCGKKGLLPTSAFSFNDVCCGNGACFNIHAFFCLEEIAERCEYYERSEKKE